MKGLPRGDCPVSEAIQTDGTMMISPLKASYRHLTTISQNVLDPLYVDDLKMYAALRVKLTVAMSDARKAMKDGPR